MLRFVVRLVPALLLLAALAVGLLAYRRYDYPDLARYQSYRAASARADAADLRAVYVGVATLLLTDGDTSILFDGFFSRPSMTEVIVGRIEPDRAAIDGGLARLGVDRLAAVICVHSHYDHCMDAPSVTQSTGAQLVGSPTTAWIGRGAGLSDMRIRTVEPPETLRYGAFTITMLESRHVPLSWNASLLGTALDGPLVPPVRASAYPEGGSYSVIVEHPEASVLVQGSAGFLEGALAGRNVDVVFLGVGGLGTKDADYVDAYWREVVETTSPETVVPIHFEDFTLPVDGPQRPMPRLADDMSATFAILEARTRTNAPPHLKLMPYWEPVRLAELAR